MKTSNYSGSLTPTKRYTFWLKREQDPEWEIFMHYFATSRDAEETIAYCQMSETYAEFKFVLIEVDMQVVKEME